MSRANGSESTGSVSEPLVSIITPVYNNAEFIGECIESVLAQTYQNWEYTILNNCSTDGSGEVARRYAMQDRRIRVLDNQQFLRAMPNHNKALRQIAPDSKYCKMVFADDWIFPDCLARMVEVAEAYPSVGIVGAYGMQGRDVMWTGLPYPSTRVFGRDVCRLLFLEDVYVFGTAGSLLYRSDLVRSHNPFYNEANLHADVESCLVLLKDCDFGFVHQVLTYKRERPESLGTFTEDVNTLIAGHLHHLLRHGQDFLLLDEFQNCKQRAISDYYNFLAVNLLRRRRDKKFWAYHKLKLNDAGVGFSLVRLAAAIAIRLSRAVLNPFETVDKMLASPRRVSAEDQSARIDDARPSIPVKGSQR